jgi:hypothetical protein
MYNKTNNIKKFSVENERSIDNILPRLSSSLMDYEHKTDEKIKKAAFISPVMITVISICLTFLLTTLIGKFIDNAFSNKRIDKIEESIQHQEAILNKLIMNTP